MSFTPPKLTDESAPSWRSSTAGAFLTDEFFEAVARRAAELVLEGLEVTPPASLSEFVTVPEAAELMRCRRQRVDDLLSRGKLRRYKDGARTLLRRAEVLEYLAGGVAPSLPRGAAARMRAGVAA